MAKYGSDDLSISVDDSGGTPVDLTQYVQTINGLDIEALTEESHSFGDAWVEHLFTGIKRGNDLTIGGFYDDTASTGPDAVLIGIGTTRTVTITWGGAKTSSFEAIIINYRRNPVRNELTKYEAVLRPTGAVTEA